MFEIFLAFLGSLCPAILFNVERKKFLWIGLSGSIGWLTFTGLNNTTGQLIFSTFLGAVAVGIYSEVMARILKAPATVFSVSGIFPLVPGIGAYETVQLIVENMLPQAASKAINTIASAGSIALGIMLVSAIFKASKRIRNSARFL